MDFNMGMLLWLWLIIAPVAGIMVLSGSAAKATR